MNKVVENEDSESIMKWFNQYISDGENSIVIYPDIPKFRQIYTEYVNREYANHNINERRSQLPRIILIAAFYETIDDIKNDLYGVGVDTQKYIDNGSLLVVDAFECYHPDISGMKKLVASLSRRATTEGRPGVTAIINMGFFFLFGGDREAIELINYEKSLSVKIASGGGSNVRSLGCYNMRDYNTLSDEEKTSLSREIRKYYKLRNSGISYSKT